MKITGKKGRPIVALLTGLILLGLPGPRLKASPPQDAVPKEIMIEGTLHGLGQRGKKENHILRLFIDDKGKHYVCQIMPADLSLMLGKKVGTTNDLSVLLGSRVRVVIKNPTFYANGNSTVHVGHNTYVGLLNSINILSSRAKKRH
jgi:hypothetical protein